MAKEYIGREAAINSLTEENLVLNLDSVMDGLSNQIKRSAHRILASLPAADVVPVRHGHFIADTNPFVAPCSECGHTLNRRWHYCPNCGAMMNKDGDGE